MAIYKQIDDRPGQADVLCSLGAVESQLGHYDQARDDYRDAMDLYKKFGNRAGQADVHNLRGLLESKLGHYEQARDSYRDAMTIYKEVDDRGGQAKVLLGLGLLDSRKNPKQAARYFVESAQLYEAIGMTEAHDAALREADKLQKINSANDKRESDRATSQPALAAHNKRHQKP